MKELIFGLSENPLIMSKLIKQKNEKTEIEYKRLCKTLATTFFDNYLDPLNKNLYRFIY